MDSGQAGRHGACVMKLVIVNKRNLEHVICLHVMEQYVKQKTEHCKL